MLIGRTGALILAVLIVTACATPTIYQKQITVTKDANGNIVGTIVVESIQQPSRKGHPVRFEHLRGVSTEE